MTKFTLSILSLTILAASLTACKKKSGIEKSVRKFDLTIEKVPYVVLPTAATSTTILKHKLNIDSLVKSVNGNYTRKNLSSLTLRSCRLTIVDETLANSLGNFSKINIGSISTDSKITSIGILSDIKDTAVFTVTVPKNTSPELVAFFNNDTISYHISGNLRKAITDTLIGDAQFIYDITVSE